MAKKPHSFIRFWFQSIRESFSFGWIVLGGLSTAMPTIITLVQRHLPEEAKVNWMAWISDNQAEIQVALAGLLLLIYLVYAPYKLYREQFEKHQNELGELEGKLSEKNKSQTAAHMQLAEKFLEQQEKIRDLEAKLADKGEADKEFEKRKVSKELFGHQLANLRIRQNELSNISGGYSYDSEMEKSETDKSSALVAKIGDSLYMHLSPAESEMFNGAKSASAGPEPYSDFDKRRWRRQNHINWLDAKYGELKRIIDKFT